MPFISLADQCLDMAAGCTVDTHAYDYYANNPETTGGINLARLQRLGYGYRQGWLANVLRRVTPLTTRSHQDYIMMADLFITSRVQAMSLLEIMSSDLTAFANAAGYHINANQNLAACPPAMQAHLMLYQSIAEKLSQKFAFDAPQPFAAGVLDATLQAQMPFIRAFMQQRITGQA